MYEDNERTVDWKSIIKKVVIVIVAIVVILGLFTLVKSCTRTDDKPNKTTPTNVNLTKQLDELEEAVLKYLTVDNLPTTVNSSKTIRLKILINREIIKEIKDDEGSTCDTSSSYAEVTKLDNNYAVKLSLTCGPNSDYRIIYVGCFENCNGSICKGEEGSTNGICELTTIENPDNTGNTTTNPGTNTNTNTNNSSGTSKPSTNTSNNTQKPNNNTNNSNTNNNSNNNSNNNNTNKPINTVIEYEFRKCEQKNFCAVGTLINGQCAIQERVTMQGKVIASGGTSTKDYGLATPKTTTTGGTTTNAKSAGTITVEPSKISNYKNTTTVGYINKGISASTGKITLAKYTCSSGTIKLINGVYKCQTAGQSKTTYSCSNGNPTNVNGVYRCIGIVNTPVTYKCENPSYTYNTSNNTCTYTTVSTRYERPSVMTTSSCQTTWSRSTTLSGWTPTGQKRTVPQN